MLEKLSKAAFNLCLKKSVFEFECLLSYLDDESCLIEPLPQRCFQSKLFCDPFDFQSGSNSLQSLFTSIHPNIDSLFEGSAAFPLSNCC